MPNRYTVSLLAIGLLLGLAAPAQADFAVSSLSAAPASTAAGAHSTFTISMDFGGSEDVKDMDLDLPPGLIGNPNSAALCSEANFQADACADDTKVGSTTVTAAVLGLVPIQAAGTVYNLVPQPGEPARLGILVQPAGSLGEIHLESAVHVRPSDGGLTSTLRDMPNTTNGLPVHISSVLLTLNDKAAKGPFMTNPTSCNVATTKITATSYNGTVGTNTAAFTPTGCDALSFAPVLTAIAGGKGGTAKNAYPGLTSTITQKPGESNTRTVTVGLPASLSANTNVLTVVCTTAQLAANACPASSKVGEAEAFTPLLSMPLTGPVYITQSSTGGLPNLTVNLTGQLSLRLTGVVGTRGQSLLTTFDGLPDVPLSQFTLRFAGGKKTALLQARSDLCTTPSQNITGTFKAQSGKTVTSKSALSVEGCPPIASGAVRSLKSTKPAIRLSLRRASASAQLGQVTITLPPGMRFDKRQMKKGLKVTTGARKVGAKSLKVTSSRTLQITKLPGTNVDSLRVALSKGFVRTSRSLAKRKRPPLIFRYAAIDANKARYRIKQTVIGR